jgi:DNA-binding transcriptional MerR regulator
MKIGELSGRSGINASAIRYYERCGLLPAPYRAGGQRRYPADALDRVLLIGFAGEVGFTLREIKVFLNGLPDDAPVGPRWKKLAHRKIQEVERSIQRARRLKSLLEHLLHCQCISL